MDITEVKVMPRQKDGKLLAFANIVFDDAFVVRGIKVIAGNKGLFISMPSRKGKTGKYQDVAHPINNDMRMAIQRAVLDAYEEAAAEENGQVSEGNEVSVEYQEE
ncbi:septation regulator SpoVG [Chitinivibrio alkaliphilus]|uniref:SpoVG family protein n=1 Tax=Chitinivibrio alkaliphilus ACht1 TaxID=1313304 RepID=U7DAR9_9BACT|nr:septation regulator SpoVG [Chitinivibrio alkaliphilus]ERP31495.1 SpoVG family protein [Chitinivibrio alkaliphilus ACht1]